MAADVDEITARVISGTNDVIHLVLILVCSALPGLPVAGRPSVHGDFRSPSVDNAIRFWSCASERVSHRRARVSFDFGLMANGTALRPGEFRTCDQTRMRSVRGKRCLRR